MPPKYFESKFILVCELSLSNEITLNGICKMKNEATNKLVKFNVNALFIFPFANSQNALVVPQTGHSTPNNLSIKQKWGSKFRKFITVFLNKKKVAITRMLLAKMLISF